MKRFFAALLAAQIAPMAFALSWAAPSAAPVVLRADSVSMTIVPKGFRFSFSQGRQYAVHAHPESGIEVGGAPLTDVVARHCTVARCAFDARTAAGHSVSIDATLTAHECVLKIVPSGQGESIVVRTVGISPAFGLGDRAATDRRDTTELTGIVDDHLVSGYQFVRLASNFVIFPKQNFGEVLPWPGVKMIHLTADENAQGVKSADGPVVMHYFFGTPHEVYTEFARMRQESDLPLLMPKYEMFGVGWEAFGALGWNTNEQTDRESVDRYLALGYPLEWVVIGSGFWPAKPDDLHETTSFGMFDDVRYPTPKSFIQHFHDEGLKVLFGLRITFITTGPYSVEGVKNHYFLEENGQPRVFKTGWPALPCYLLNAQSPQAVDWYMGLVAKWKAFGVDGFKEDFYGFGPYDLRDDKVDPINKRLMAEGDDLIERNGYIASNGDLQRINDFNYDQDQDRGPVNSLALAYSGLPLVYPDIVGGTFGEKRFNTGETPAMGAYMMRNAQWAALHSSMSMGQPPWTFKNPQVGEVMLKAAVTHERLHPYIYSQAVRFIHDGYPWTMTPLPVAYPNEEGVYGRENRSVRGYEWMIGDALLATPLYGDDYATAETRDVYLPEGKWMDYETGEIASGPTILKSFSLPVAKTPLFVGGTGIVFEQQGGGVVARVYPINPRGRTEFWSADGKTRSAVELRVQDWEHIKVTDATTHHTVAFRQVRFAAEFPLIPGHAYLVQ